MPEKITFFESYYKAGKSLSVKERREFFDAVLLYAFEGVEPTLEGAAYGMFLIAKPIIDTSSARAKSGAKGGKQNRSKLEANSEANLKQNASKTEAKEEFACENLKEKSVSNIYSYSNSYSFRGVGDLLALAHSPQCGVAMTEQQAEAYLNSRQASGWRVNGSQIVNIPADIKRFVLNWEAMEKKHVRISETALQGADMAYSATERGM